MKVKKWIGFFCAALMLASLLVMPAMAAEQEQQIIDLGDGFYVVRTITVQAATRAGNTVRGSISDDLYYQDVKIGSATLTASFDISGSTAVAEEAFLQGSATNGWTYSNGGTYCSSNRASGTAIFRSGSITQQLPLSISCTPDGELY